MVCDEISLCEASNLLEEQEFGADFRSRAEQILE